MTNVRSVTQEVKSYILSEFQKTNDWVNVDIKFICNKWGIPIYLSRYILTLLRIDPEIRYEYINTPSRFKPKKFKIDIPERKLKDIGTIQQTELKTEEETFIIKKLEKYQTVNNLELFYSLLDICEKLKIKCFHREWGIIKPNEFSKFLDISDTTVIRYINILNEAKVLIKSPANVLSFKLMLSEENISATEEEISEIVIDTKDNLTGETNFNILSNSETFSELKELESLKNNFKSIMDCNAKISSLMINQLQIFDALTHRDEAIRKQKTTAGLLSDAYNEITNKYEELEKKYNAIMMKNKALEKMIDDRTEHIRSVMNNMYNESSTIIDDYIKLPTFKKNSDAVNSKFKRDLNKVLLHYSDMAIDYRKE